MELDIYNRKSDVSIVYINLAIDQELKFLSGRYCFLDDFNLSSKLFFKAFRFSNTQGNKILQPSQYTTTTIAEALTALNIVLDA